MFCTKSKFLVQNYIVSFCGSCNRFIAFYGRIHCTRVSLKAKVPVTVVLVNHKADHIRHIRLESQLPAVSFAIKIAQISASVKNGYDTALQGYRLPYWLPQSQLSSRYTGKRTYNRPDFDYGQLQ